MKKIVVSFAMDDRWITVKPNGADKKGKAVQIDNEGRVKKGMGGKFTGQKINEVSKKFVGAKTPSSEQLSKARQNAEKSKASSKDLIHEQMSKSEIRSFSKAYRESLEHEIGRDNRRMPKSEVKQLAKNEVNDALENNPEKFLKAWEDHKADIAREERMSKLFNEKGQLRISKEDMSKAEYGLKKLEHEIERNGVSPEDVVGKDMRDIKEDFKRVNQLNNGSSNHKYMLDRDRGYKDEMYDRFETLEKLSEYGKGWDNPNAEAEKQAALEKEQQQKQDAIDRARYEERARILRGDFGSPSRKGGYQSFKDWHDDADMPTRDKDGTWYDAETGLAAAWNSSSDSGVSHATKEYRKFVKQFGAKALKGTAKQKEWAEKIRGQTMAKISDDAARFLTTSPVFEHSRFWIDNRDKTAKDFETMASEIERLKAEGNREKNQEFYNKWKIHQT